MTGALLAVDPGPNDSAWCILSATGTVLGFAKEPNKALRERLTGMVPEFSGGPALFTFAIERVPVELVAIERIGHYGTGMPAGASVFDTCYESGKFELLCEQAGIPVRWVMRGEVKMHLCRSMRAKDANIRQSLIDRLGPPGTKKSPAGTYGIAGDVWSAVAVGITARETPWTP